MASTKGIIIILGSPNDAEGRLSSIALERCEQALVEHRKHPDFRILPTGGWGEHFNTTDKAHGHYLRQELLRRGVCDSVVLPCAESSNTVEDARLSRPILDEYPSAELIVVTSEFHEGRARFLFEREFPERTIRFSTSETHLPTDDLARRRAHEERALEKLRNDG
jgi:uncharacterized SAM-binding protein YcdF (DUF218 family)